MAGMASAARASSCPATISFSSTATVSSFSSFFSTSSFAFTDLRGLPRPLKGAFSSFLSSTFSSGTNPIEYSAVNKGSKTTAPLDRRSHLHFLLHLLLCRILYFINRRCGKFAITDGASLGRRRHLHLLISILLLLLHFLQRRLAGTAGASEAPYGQVSFNLRQLSPEATIQGTPSSSSSWVLVPDPPTPSCWCSERGKPYIFFSASPLLPSASYSDSSAHHRTSS
ncbi:hypothetical protein PENTCL1PPCAC_15231 [Pristionchus entomophagus]|uniref:Uncharacterized protein n=1 Tax=Pristionchus entomophagus TaxID=358040 RepID=A0AAV5TBW4_9BILA|nr:hypothetical protein PENTCL1PPCAC_15231 [Pristionchus entomophagus]